MSSYSGFESSHQLDVLSSGSGIAVKVTFPLRAVWILVLESLQLIYTCPAEKGEALVTWHSVVLGNTCMALPQLCTSPGKKTAYPKMRNRFVLLLKTTTK